MQKIMIAFCLMLAVAGVGSAAVTALTDGPAQELLKPDQVIKQLLEGNTRYVKQQTTALAGWGKPAAASLAKPSRPCAVILCCADTPIPPEVLFDKGAGCLFVLRVAGNIVNPTMLGSIEYAVEQLGAPVVMVLGHERCGVVATAISARGTAQGNYGALLRSIEPAVRQALVRNATAAAPELVELTIDLNAKMMANSLADRSAVLKRLVGQGQVRVVAAKLDSDNGKVALLD